ncbi:leucine-rich repeat-containing protein 36 isoform X2 [Dermochelys coriacea]|uniref:leucine-rich repeat-containing protein 36 isoform X2 n=1 Tax=Dermochelys coriacea TaxID=27794 RepID=UPI0018E70888|nr:leucine-rich repeat-containing protein 36 isoform X2 [Dermochelys coriacea]
MALQRELSEAWIREQAALRGIGPEQVESLSLQGTYAGKIHSLGDAFKNFKSLQSLDLSRNMIVSLEGIEYLYLLQNLNLYYNHISSLLEVSRLQTLPVLSELDLRLNPITRKESDYRLFAVYTLQALEKLDDRIVRESERKSAMLHFGLKRKEDCLFSEKESVSYRENTVKNYAVDKGTSSVSSLDIDSSRNQTESSQKQLTHKRLLKCEAKDSSINALSASAVQASSSAKENKQCSNTLGTQLEEVAGKQLLNHSHLEDEYRSLPSPPQMRSSLRSPDKIRAGLTRGGFRVTFSENDSLDSSLEKDVIGKPNIYYLNQDISSTKKLHLSDTNKTNSYKSHRDTGLDSYDHLYLSSTPQNKDFKRLQKDKRSTNFRDYSVSPANEIKTTSQSTSSDLLTQHTEMDNSTRSLLKLNSDLNTSTHPTSEPALLATHFSTLSTSFSDLTSRHQPLSAEALLEQSQPATMRKTFPSAMPRKDSESTANRCLSPSRIGYKQSDRLYSSLSPQHCFKESNKESVPSDLSNDTSFTESQSPKRTEKASHIAVVLQQLLELVDRYWDGAGSLLLNKNFLAPAQDLLLYLMASTPPQKDVHLPGGDSPSVLAGNAPRLQRTQLKYAEPFDRANLALQQAKGQEESHVSSSQLQEVDYTAASNYCFSRTHSLTYDELLHKNEQLSVHVEYLTLELKQHKKLQETVHLLQESQRSLVSTNNFLLQQLNKEHNPNSVKTTLSSEKFTIRERSPPLERTPPVSAHGYSQYCNAEQLSNSPL